MRLLGLFAAAALLIAGIVALQAVTETEHEPAVPGSETELVFEAEIRRSEQPLGDMAETLLLQCRLEVPADLAEPVEHVAGRRFRVVLTPALDAADERQLEGCLEDTNIDHVKATVVSVTHHGL